MSSLPPYSTYRTDSKVGNLKSCKKRRFECFYWEIGSKGDFASLKRRKQLRNRNFYLNPFIYNLGDSEVNHGAQSIRFGEIPVVTLLARRPSWRCHCESFSIRSGGVCLSPQISVAHAPKWQKLIGRWMSYLAWEATSWDSSKRIFLDYQHYSSITLPTDQ